MIPTMWLTYLDTTRSLYNLDGSFLYLLHKVILSLIQHIWWKNAFLNWVAQSSFWMLCIIRFVFAKWILLLLNIFYHNLFSGIQIGSNQSRRIVVEFRCRRDLNNRLKVVDSNISSFNENLLRNWKWTLNLKSFEVVHGMSRVVMLSPGKYFSETF